MRPPRARLLAVPLLLGLVTACAPPRFLAVPTAAKEPAHVVAPEADLETRLGSSLQPLDDARTVLYLQTYGGSVGVGLLLGPFGVAANAAAMGNKTKEEAALLKGKLPWDPAALYAEVAKGRPELSGTGDKAAVRVSPQLLVVKTEGDVLLLGCALQVDHRPAGQEWKATYLYQTRQRFPLAEAAKGLAPAQLQAAEAELRAGFQALTALYFDDLRGKLGPGKDVTYKSDFVTPRFVIEWKGKEVPGPGDRVVLRAVGAMLSLPRDAVQVAVARPAGQEQGAGQ